MKENLENSKDRKSTRPAVATPVELSDDFSEVDVEELEFDDDGNLIGADDLDDDSEDDSELGEDEQDDAESLDEQEEETESDEEEAPKAKPATKKKLTPADIKVIELKKELKKEQKEKQELAQKITAKQNAQVETDLVAKYVAQGFDEDTAKDKASMDIRLKSFEERQTLIDFREENYEVFARYPKARAYAKEIMQAANAGFLSVEEICRTKFGGKPEREERASAAARGQSTREVADDGQRVSRADRAGKAPTAEGLTAEQRKDKAQLERVFNNGKKMTVQEYLNVSRL
jgi:hypothetical protein